MQGPDDRNAAFPEILKELLNIEIIAVQVMKMHKIRRKHLQVCDHFNRFCRTFKAMAVKQKGFDHMPRKGGCPAEIEVRVILQDFLAYAV